MISMNLDVPSRAVACAGSHGIAALRGAMRMAPPLPTGDAAPALPRATASATAPASQLESVMRQRRLAGPWTEQQGRSVFAGTSSLARKAEAHRRNAATNDGYVVLIDVWVPDPWRPHPV